MTDYKAVKIIRNGCEFNFAEKTDNSKYVDLLLIGGGGGGGSNLARGCSGAGGGGGAGGVYLKTCFKIDGNQSVIIGTAGAGATAYQKSGCNGGDSCFGGLIAHGGGGGGGVCGASFSGCSGGSGGGAGVKDTNSGYILYAGGRSTRCGICGELGYNGGETAGNLIRGGGGGGAGYAGYGGYTGNPGEFSLGGSGICSDIEGTMKMYAGGGGGGQVSCNWGYAFYGGGQGGRYTTAGVDGSTCGSGGGGGGAYCEKAGSGASGLLIVRYPTDGSYGIHCATGGCKYTCGDYTIHCFISNDNFCIVC